MTQPTSQDAEPTYADPIEFEVDELEDAMASPGGPLAPMPDKSPTADLPSGFALDAQ